jgi:hypothetical protein
MQPPKIAGQFGLNLRLYALVVAAFTLSIFALPAGAEVIYTSEYLTTSGTGTFKIGITGITIVSSGKSIFCAGTGPGSYGLVYAVPAQGDGVVANSNYALALSSGVVIGPSRSFYYAEALMADYSTCLWPPHENLGAWLDVMNRYLGLKFQINGQTHYGWARLSVTAGRFGPVVTLTGYAYETVPGHAIYIGQTSGY